MGLRKILSPLEESIFRLLDSNEKKEGKTLQPRNLRSIVYLLLVQQLYLREMERRMSTDSLVRKISSRLYYLACYRFFFRFLTLRGHIKEKLAFH